MSVKLNNWYLWLEGIRCYASPTMLPATFIGEIQGHPTIPNGKRVSLFFSRPEKDGRLMIRATANSPTIFVELGQPEKDYSRAYPEAFELMTVQSAAQPPTAGDAEKDEKRC